MYVDLSTTASVLVERPGLRRRKLQRYLDRLGVRSNPGWRAEINLRAVDWIRDVARRLRRGFVILIDYGHEARELYSAVALGRDADDLHPAHDGGPGRHGRRTTPAWLQEPGEQDITAHVDFTSLRASAEPKADHARLSRPDVFPAGTRRGPGFDAEPENRREPWNLENPDEPWEPREPQAESRAEDAAHARRSRQHAQGAHPGQRGRDAVARRVLVQALRVDLSIYNRRSMTAMMEREIKLRFDNAEAARRQSPPPAPRRCADAGCRRIACSTPTTNSLRRQAMRPPRPDGIAARAC